MSYALNWLETSPAVEIGLSTQSLPGARHMLATSTRDGEPPPNPPIVWYRSPTPNRLPLRPTDLPAANQTATLGRLHRTGGGRRSRPRTTRPHRPRHPPRRQSRTLRPGRRRIRTRRPRIRVPHERVVHDPQAETDPRGDAGWDCQTTVTTR